MTNKKSTPLRKTAIWGATMAAVGLIAVTVFYTQGKIAENNARLMPPATPAVEVSATEKDVAPPPGDESLAISAPRVSTLAVEPGAYRTEIQAFGEVKAKSTLALNSETSGRVEWIAPEFEVGQQIKAGTVLLKISERNYLSAQANAIQERANAQQEVVMAQQELSSAHQEMAAAEQDRLSAQQSIPNAYQANASADQGIASGQEAIASARQELSASYHEIASAEQELKQEQDLARTSVQPWNGRDAVASAQQEVENALLAVKQEKAQALTAQADWKLAGMSGRPTELASRQPQLAAANARFHAAKLALQKAQYELKQQGGELAQRKPQINAARARLTTAKARLQTAKNRLITANKQAVTAKAQSNASRGDLPIAKAQIKTARARMNSAKAKMKSAQARINTAKVRIKTAEVAIEKAEYDLKSTTIRAPFNAIVTSKSVGIGSYVNAGADLGEIRSSDSVEITLALSSAQAGQLSLDGDTVVELSSDDYPSVVWQGEIDRMANFIQPQTRTRDIIVRVDQPLEQETPLLTGSFVKANLTGKEQQGLLKIPSSSLAANGYLWFVDDQHNLQRIERSVVFTQDGALFVKAPESVDQLNIVRWPLASYLPGMAVTPTSDTGGSNNASGQSEKPTRKTAQADPVTTVIAQGAQ